jgi:hypothetical protein
MGALLTSQVAAVLQVVDALAQVALAQLLSDKAHHHGADPLFPDDGVLGGLEGLVVVVVHAVEGGGHLRLLRLEHLGFGGRHRGEVFFGSLIT